MSRGYLRTDLETIKSESKKPLTIEDLQSALKLVQTLEPAGWGRRIFASVCCCRSMRAGG